MKGYTTKKCEDLITSSVFGFGLLKDTTLICNNLVRYFNSTITDVMIDSVSDRKHSEIALCITCDNTASEMPEEIAQELRAIVGNKYPTILVEYDPVDNYIIKAAEVSDKKPVFLSRDILNCKKFFNLLQNFKMLSPCRLHLTFKL